MVMTRSPFRIHVIKSLPYIAAIILCWIIVVGNSSATLPATGSFTNSVPSQGGGGGSLIFKLAEGF